MKTPESFFFACFLTGGIPKKHTSQDDPGSGSVPQDDDITRPFESQRSQTI